MWYLILLLMVGSAYAQPVWGPFEVTTTNDEIKEFEVCVRGDTADVLSLLRNSSNYYGFDLNLTEQISGYVLQIPGEYPVRQLLDMTAVSSERWICLLHRNTRENFSYGSFNFTTDLVYGNASVSGMLNVETSSYVDFPDYHSGNWTQGHALRFDHERVDVAYYNADIGPFDIWYTACVYEYDNDLNVVHSTQTVGYFGGPFAEVGNRITATRLPGDSVLVCSASQNGVDIFLGPWLEIENDDYRVTSNCEYANLQESFLTDSGRIVGAFDDNLLKQIVLGEENTAECIEFAPSGLNDVSAWAFHPNFGFAAIQATPGNLLLARIDTSGNEVHPVGILYATDGPPYVLDADVTITDDGKVVCVWSEYTQYGEGPRVLKIAWTDWSTFLDTPEQQSPAIPSEISLSSYPNPFNSTVTIEYDLPISSDVRLDVFDIQGRLTATLFNDFTSAGSHSVSWSPEQLASGVYFASLKLSTEIVTRKVLYLK